jgi:hypothetical protein
MNLSSKYDMGQRVASIMTATVDHPPVKCPACEDGTVLLCGERYQCPNCKGKKTIQATGRGWVVGVCGRIGSVEIEHRIVTEHTSFDYDEDEIEEGQAVTRTSYMLDETGIGSGSIYPERRLFSSREEAQAECDKRNGYHGAQP